MASRPASSNRAAIGRTLTGAASNAASGAILAGAGAIAAAAAATYGATSGLLGYGRDGMVAIATGAGQLVWEAAYALGVNQAPETNQPVTDPLPRPVAALPADALEAPAAASALPPTPPIQAAVVASWITPRRDDPALLAYFIHDHAARQPDGRVFVPKPLQRLFALRTRQVSESDVPVSIALAGRIVPDPHSHGHVEASLAGRIAAPPAGLPVLGDRVTKDQVLGLVTPAIGLVERVQMHREVARLTAEIRIEAEALERLKQFVFVPFRDGKIYQSQAKTDGLRGERAALLAMLDTQEVLRAPVGGVISRTQAVEGGIVRPGEVIFDIVDPGLLWVEAMAPDPAVALDASSIIAASARTPEGQTLQVSFVGSGLALREQSTPMLFRIHGPPAGLRLDRPVTVSLQGRRTERGIPIPRDAVTTGLDGVQEVWEQTAPEHFTARPVQLHELDGDSVLVVNGLADGARVVAGGGIRLMAQLQ